MKYAVWCPEYGFGDAQVIEAESALKAVEEWVEGEEYSDIHVLDNGAERIFESVEEFIVREKPVEVHTQPHEPSPDDDFLTIVVVSE